MTWHLIAIAYAAAALATFLYLIQIGRSGLTRRLYQALAALGWPAYWLIIQGPRSTVVAIAQVTAFVVLSVFLIALLPLVALERRHLIS